MISYDEAKVRSTVIKAMAHPTRLIILEFLKDGEKSVGEINTLFDADTSTISKHLAVLKNVGILGDRKEGSRVYYCLQVPCILDFFQCVTEVIKHNVRSQVKAV